MGTKKQQGTKCVVDVLVRMLIKIKAPPPMLLPKGVRKPRAR